MMPFMNKIKNTSAITISLMLSLSAVHAEESQPWWKSSKTKNKKETAPKIEKKAQPKPPLVSKEQKKPWWKQPQKTKSEEKQLEVAKSITPKTEKPEEKKSTSQLAKAPEAKKGEKKSGFWSKLFSSRKKTTKKQVQKKTPSEEPAPEPELAVEEKQSEKAPSFSFFKNLFKRPAKPSEPEKIVVSKKENPQAQPQKTKEVSSKPEPKPEKAIAKKAPATPRKAEPQEVKTSVTIIPEPIIDQPSEKNSEDKGLSNFFKNLFKKKDTATKVSSKRRIKRLGKEDEGYYVPSVSHKLRRKGHIYHQFNT